MKKIFLICALVGTVFSSQAFVIKTNGSQALRWSLLVPNVNVSTNVVNNNTKAVRYFLASDGYSTTNTAAELNALRASFAQWQSISDTHLKFEDAGLVSPPVDVNAGNNTNVVYWAKDDTLVNGNQADISGALAVTFTSFLNNYIFVGADIVFNGVERSWFTDFSDTENSAYFVEAVALHEIGHFIGLAHSPVGGASMLYAGSSGVNLQTGLSADEMAAARFLYPLAPTNYGAVRGFVTSSGNPIFGAAVFAEDANTNLVSGTMTRSDGSYLLSALPPGNYRIRVAPLDPAGVADFLARGSEIDSTFNAAQTSFSPSSPQLTTVNANSTNLVNFPVTSGVQPFRIARIRRASTSLGGFSLSSLPTTMTVGQSNYYIGVASSNLPTAGASLTITGDGLTVGEPIFQPNGFLGLNYIIVPISVASNATPGLRSFIVQQGSGVAYANGFLEILPAEADHNFDGLEDTFQREFFPLFTSAAAAPGADPDGDNFNNYAEYISGSNPTNAASYLRIESVTMDASGTTVRWPSAPGRRYQVFSRAEVGDGNWQAIGSPVTAEDTTAEYFDATAKSGMRFYRIQALP